MTEPVILYECDAEASLHVMLIEECERARREYEHDEDTALLLAAEPYEEAEVEQAPIDWAERVSR